MNGGYGALTLLMGLWGDRQYTPVDSCANLLLLHLIKLNGSKWPIAVGTMLVDRRVAGRLPQVLPCPPTLSVSTMASSSVLRLSNDI